MKMLLFVLLSLSAFATESQLSALGQPSGGSFYLANNRNFLRNPGALGGYAQVSYDVDAKDLILNEDDFVLAAGRLDTHSSSILGAYKFSEALGISLQTSAQSGKFFDDIGFKIGVDLDGGVGAYLGYRKEEGKVVADTKEEDNEGITAGLALPYGSYTLFTEYSDVLRSKNYNFLLGLAYEFDKLGVLAPFADLTYGRAFGGIQKLELTAGLSAKASESFVVMASINHDFVFRKSSSLSAGLDFSVTKDLILGASGSLSPFTKDHVHYSDIDTKLSVTYVL